MKNEITHNELGKIAWDAYAKSVGGKAFNGDLLPTWEVMCNDKSKAHLVKAWEAAAIAVDEAACASFLPIVAEARASMEDVNKHIDRIAKQVYSITGTSTGRIKGMGSNLSSPPK